MNEQPPLDFGPWASPSESRTQSRDPAPGGGLGAYRPHTSDHVDPSASSSSSGHRLHAPAHTVSPTASPTSSPGKTLPAHPLAPRRRGPSHIHASASIRAVAAMIDGGLLALAVGPGLALLLADRLLPGVVVLMLGLLALASIQSALTVAQGQSLAKRWLGLRLIDRDGGRVGYFRGVVLRGAVMPVVYVASAGIVLLVELALLVRKSPSLADRLARTKVIEARTFGDPYVD